MLLEQHKMLQLTRKQSLLFVKYYQLFFSFFILCFKIFAFITKYNIDIIDIIPTIAPYGLYMYKQKHVANIYIIINQGIFNDKIVFIVLLLYRLVRVLYIALV